MTFLRTLAGHMRRGVLGLWIALLASSTALAIDVGLPGERKIELHGFYELRLVGLGDDLPANGVTLSQFRHILNLETDVELFPDGIGPFDLMSLYARTAVRYDCVYTRACGLFPSSDAFGDLDRGPDRLPYSIRRARNAQYIGGTAARTRLAPGSLSTAQGLLNPGRTPRGLFNRPGELININEVALLANLNHWQASQLDLPIDRFLVLDDSFGEARRARHRAGLTIPASLRAGHLLLLRDDLGFQRSAGLATLLDQSRFVSASQHPMLRALNGLIGRLSREGDPSGRLPALRSQRDGLLFSDPSAPSLDTLTLDYLTFAPEIRRGLAIPEVAGADALNLIRARSDESIFVRLARATTPELLEEGFAGMLRSNAGVATYFANTDFPVKPFGHFDTRGAGIDLISNTAAGVAQTVGKVDVATYSAGLIGAPPNQEAITRSFQLISRPRYVGPDGRQNTSDDLPETGSGLASGLRLVERGSPEFPVSTWSDDSRFDRVALIEGSLDTRPGASTEGTPLVLFGVLGSQAVLEGGCTRLGGVLQDGVCMDATGPLPVEEVRKVGCQTLAGADGGLNEQQECLVLNVRQGSPAGSPPRGIHREVLRQLANPAFRPADALKEPTDLTEFRNLANFGTVLPARPRAEGNQLAFGSTGLRNLQRRSHHMVSNLDIDFGLDELAWGHGASDDEHELREGFIEAELFDSEVFARLGKLVMVWGKTELFRNQDRLNPIDLSEGVATRLEEARVGQWALDLVYSPEWAMRLGRFEDLRLELALIFDDFQPQDFGICGESSSLDAVCLLPYGVLAHGLTGIGVAGAENPYASYGGLKRFDYALRLEGRMDRFTFAVTDFWGWDDNFVLEVIHQYGRRADPETGAPVNATGPLACKIRTVDGVAVGPNGVSGDSDDVIPSVGNCLLFDDPPGPGVAQSLRAGREIAANHAVNQTLFHTICTVNFDPDVGYCPFDQINEISQFEGGAQLLSGIPLAVQSSVLEGVDSIALDSQGPAAPSFTPTRNVLAAAQQLFKPIAPGNPASLPITRSQGALLGCGASFVSPCGRADIDAGGFASGPVFQELRGFSTQQIGGGPDFMNADASVVMQDFSILKGLQPGAAVGTRHDFSEGGLRYETGVSIAGMDALVAARELGLSAGEILPQSLEGRSGLIREALELEEDELIPRTAATDAWIEPYPWQVDRDALQRGLLLFKVADSTKRDPRCDPDLPGRARDVAGFPVFSDEEVAICGALQPAWLSDPNVVVLNDPTDPTNPANEFVIEFEGGELDLFSAPGEKTPAFRDWIRRVADIAEQCTPFVLRTTASPLAGTAFEDGCTALEIVSANIERFLAAVEIMGSDRVFDPPETFDELQTVIDGDFSNDAFGDPISGPDGINTRNFRVFDDGSGAGATRADVHGLLFTIGQERIRSLDARSFDFAAAGLDPQDQVVLSDMTIDQFFVGLNPESLCGSDNPDPCYLRLGEERLLENGRPPQIVPVAAAMPVAMRMNLSRIDGKPVSAELFNPRVNLMELLENHPVEFAALWAGDAVTIPNFTLKYDRPQTNGKFSVTGDVTIRIPIPLLAGESGLRNFDFDGDPAFVLELDQDQDGIYDGLDDGAPGPATDDNVLCGTGLPGDVLQNAQQYQLASLEDEARLAAAYPRGFPRRSPTLCRTLNDLLISSGQTLPILLAGGDGRYGRRDFLWHGGQELTLTWEKRNVLGFAMDFAEDRTGTSWGIEFSWTHDAHVPNANRRNGVSNLDPMVLSVSVDRPTFFNFLNPNRSFFLNFQFFVQYLSDFSGGRDDEDGNFPYAEGPWSGLVTFTFFTGYFQDRLNPRSTLVWEPTTNQGIVLWNLNYRWTATFSTGLAVSHFFGAPEDGRRFAFPFTLFQNSFTEEEQLFRGFNAVRNRDLVELNARYTW